jgi:sugar phosphate isomerase/epimerase
VESAFDQIPTTDLGQRLGMDAMLFSGSVDDRDSIPIPRCCATSSLPPFPASSLPGSSTNLPSKLQAIAQAGFRGIELAFPDLVAFAHQCQSHEGAQVFEDVIDAATKVKSACDTLDLTVVMLQPFANWEGWDDGSDEQKDAFERADCWIRVMKAAGTDMLQVSYFPF